MDSSTLLIILVIGVAVLLVRSFLPSYASEKGKNLATREDIARITDEIERVKANHSARLKEIEHQHSLLLEELRGRQQLRMAAIEKRLEVHQHAFTLWRQLLRKAHSDDVGQIVIECQSWWERNCLYLSPQAREAFNRAYFAAQAHRSFTQSHTNAKLVEDNWALIMRAGEAIVSGVELPTLGEREALDARSNLAQTGRRDQPRPDDK
jgi:hypothetical protein